MPSLNINNAPNANSAFCEALFEELACHGVQQICICPGSRSAPLAIAAKNIENKLQADKAACDFQVSIHLDERSAAFYALGLAKASGRVVALVCTSGTALANFLPAVIEANYACVPLLVLSADRPAELREWGAGQTIDQPKLFGDNVRWFAESPLPEASAVSLRYVRSLAGRGVYSAQSVPCGPVHINFPFREPLDPSVIETERKALALLANTEGRGLGGSSEGKERRECYLRCEESICQPDSAALKVLSSQLSCEKHGLIVCGNEEAGRVGESFVVQLTKLAKTLKVPVLADPASQVRFSEHLSDEVVAHHQLLLSDERFAEKMQPQWLLFFGAPAVSKSLRLWLLRHSAVKIILVDAQQRWNNADHLLSQSFSCSAQSFVDVLLSQLEAQQSASDSSWLSGWQQADTLAENCVAQATGGSAPSVITEAQIGARLPEIVAGSSALFLSSSMPIRDIDTFAPCLAECLPVFCNRGANGIDGILSTALGVASVVQNDKRFSQNHSVLLCGDLAFLHDVAGLLAAKRYPVNLSIVVINNDGGGIFSFLPVARFEQKAYFDELFTCSHGLTLENAALLYRLAYHRVLSMADLALQLQQSRLQGGVHLIEVEVDRELSLAHHREIVQHVGEALSELCLL